MTWRGVLTVTVLAFVFFTGMAAAGPVTINSPTNTTYSQDASVTINISTDGAHTLTEYAIPTANPDPISESGNGDTVYDSALVGDGEHRLTATAEDSNGSTASETVYFKVDTNGPTITSQSPEDTVFNRYPVLDIKYTDALSSVDTASVNVWVDNTAVTGTTTAERFNATLNNISEGNHTVTVKAADVHGNHLRPAPNTGISWSFTIPKKPVLSGAGPKGLIDADDSDEVTVVLTAKDPAGINVNQSRFKVIRERDGKVLHTLQWDDISHSTQDGGVKVTASHELTDLGDGGYTVEAEVRDMEHNEATAEWSFTIDTTSPSVDVLSHTDGDVVKGEQTVVVEASDDLSSVAQVRVELGDDADVVQTAEDDTFHADIDTNKAGDGDRTLTVTAEDAAENTRTEEVSVFVDNTRPDVRDIQVYPESVPTEAKVTATVEDTATGISQVSYRVKGADLTGTMVPEDGSLDEDTERVFGTLNVESLSNGQHTLYVIAEDGADHTTTTSAKFSVDDSLSANLSLVRGAERLVDAGSQETVTVKVTNTGETDELVRLSSSSALVKQVKPTEKRVHTGETKGFQVTLNVPGDHALGAQQVPFTVQGLNSAAQGEFPVSVQPRPTRQQEIEQQLQTLKDEFADLSASKTKYEDDVEAESAEETFSATESTITTVESLIEEGRYYEASQKLDRAETRLASAETALTGMISTYKRQQLISTVLKSLAVLLFLGVLAGVYLMAPGEEGMSEDGFVMREDDRHPLQRTLENAGQTMQETVQDLRQRMGEALNGETATTGGSATAASSQRGSTQSGRPQGWSGYDPE